MRDYLPKNLIDCLTTFDRPLENFLDKPLACTVQDVYCGTCSKFH